MAYQRRKMSLTKKQDTFVETYARTADPQYSALKAGYAHPDANGYEMLGRATVKTALEAKRASREDLANALPAVVEEHKRRLLDPKTTNREFAGLVAPFYKAAGITNELGEAKEPHEMTAEEIAKAIDALERQAMSKAIDVQAVEVPESGAFD